VSNAEVQEPPSDPSERPVPKEVFERPDVRAGIEWAQAKIREGRVRPGKTAEELLAFFDEFERKQMDTRP